MNELALEPQKDLGDYLGALARRKLPMLLVMTLIALAGTVVALALPPVYRSTATILIEEQEIPQDLVRTTISSYADQRIQVISQQVMTRSNLMKIVDKYDLYADQRRKLTTEEIVDRMRRDIRLDVVTADVTDRRSGSKTTATIAFRLSFESESADKAQKAANELTSLYLNENLQLRQQKVAETSKFLSEESDRLRDHIAGIEARLAAFKAKNAGQLPELSQVNMQMRDRADLELFEVDRQLATLEERRILLESQLTLLKPTTPVFTGAGAPIPEPEERLRGLRAQYSALSGVYAQDHPDMTRMRRQIEALEAETGVADDGAEESKALVRLEGELADLRERYAPDHPEVIKLQRGIAALRTRMAEAAATPRAAMPVRKPDNPAYISLQTQLETIELEKRSLRAKRAELDARMALVESRIERSPAVEKEYLELSRDRESSVARYRELAAKLMQAQVAEELEKDRKSERFSLIEPPVRPEKPRSPNRPLIMVMGLVLALVGGGATATLLEILDKSVHGPRELQGLLAVPLLSVIPYIATADEQRRTRRRRNRVLWALLGTALAAALGLAAAIHFLWMPLDVFWFWLLRRFNLS